MNKLCDNQLCNKRTHCYLAQKPIGGGQTIMLDNTKDNCFQMFYTKQEYEKHLNRK